MADLSQIQVMNDATWYMKTKSHNKRQSCIFFSGLLSYRGEQHSVIRIASRSGRLTSGSRCLRHLGASTLLHRFAYPCWQHKLSESGWKMESNDGKIGLWCAMLHQLTSVFKRMVMSATRERNPHPKSVLSTCSCCLLVSNTSLSSHPLC